MGNADRKKRSILPVLSACCIAVVILAVLTMAGRIVSSDSPEESVPVLNAAVENQSSQNGYDRVLEKYKAAVAESWTAEQCEMEGISPRMQAGADLTKAGFAKLDLDGDGREELVIAEESLPHIDVLWAVYTTLEDGTPVQLWVDECDGNQCYLYEGNILGTEYTTKTEAEYIYYTLESGRFVMRESLYYEDEDSVLHTDAQGDTHFVTSREAMDISGSYKHQKLKLTWLMETPEHPRDDDSLEYYALILEKYRTALREEWDLSQCGENDISLMVSHFVESPDRLCAFFLDLDENGVQELMITDGMMIYDLYTLENKQPVHLLTGWERNSYQFCMDNYIANHGSGGAALSLYNYYRMENGKLVLQESILFDAAEDPEHPWFRNNDGQTPGEPLTQEQAEECMNSYRTMSILGIPVLELSI